MSLPQPMSSLNLKVLEESASPNTHATWPRQMPAGSFIASVTSR